MTRSHMAPCIVLVFLGLALLLATGVSPVGIATFGFFLLCPLIMVGMMWWMGGHGGHAPGGDRR
jgi:hypothetical protein